VRTFVLFETEIPTPLAIFDQGWTLLKLLKMNAIKSLFRSTSTTKEPTHISLLCNYTSCRLGQYLQASLSNRITTISVAHNAATSDTTFQAFLNEQQDRDRLISYLKQNNFRVKYLVFNQPFKLRPVVDDPLAAQSDDEKDQSKVLELKDKVRILIETPLFTVAELYENELMSHNAQLL